MEAAPRPDPVVLRDGAGPGPPCVLERARRVAGEPLHGAIWRAGLPRTMAGAAARPDRTTR